MGLPSARSSAFSGKPDGDSPRPPASLRPCPDARVGLILYVIIRLAGELYDASDFELQAELAATHRWLARYNAALDATTAERQALLLERLAEVGDGAMIRPPFHCDYGFKR